MLNNMKYRIRLNSMKPSLHGVYFLLGGLIVACWSACTTEVDLKALRKPPKLVLNSRLAAGDTVTARVTRTWFYTEKQPDILLPDAEVSLYVDGEWKERMRWQPADRRYGREGCFLSAYRAASGDRIRIEASAPGYEKSWAEVTIPAASPLSDVQLSSRTYSYPGHTRIVTDYDLTLRDDPAEKNYYIVELEEGYRFDSIPPSGPVYSWVSVALDFSRDPVFADQATALDKFFGHDGSSYLSGQAFADDLFAGKEYVLKFSSSSYIYNGAGGNTGYGESAGYGPDEGYGSFGKTASVDASAVVREGEIPSRLLRFRLYTLSESYYLYLRSLIALGGESFEGDLSELGLSSPVRVYSNVEGGGTGVVAAYAADYRVVSPPSAEE